MTREQLLREFADAFEQVINTAMEVERRGATAPGDRWGPREVVAHLAGWEVMASVRIPAVVAGMAPLEFEDEERQTVMNDAINATIVTIAGEQSLETLCGMLRAAYRQTVELLQTLDEHNFQPGAYVYERTRSVTEHCHEHIEMLLPASRETGEPR